MKRIIFSIVLLIVSTIVIACPKPTSHAVIALGASYEYNLTEKVWSKDLIGIQGRAGWEDPYRYVTLSVVGGYVFGLKDWKLGGEVMLNPLGARYGYCTPINFGIILGGGYKSRYGGYGDVGIELSARMGHLFSPYARATYEINEKRICDGVSSSIMSGGFNMSIGVRVWLGKEW